MTFSPEDYPRLLEAFTRTMIDAGTLTPVSRNAFFSDLSILELGEKTLTLLAPNEIARQSILTNYRKPFLDAIADVLRSPRDIDIIVREDDNLENLQGYGTTISPLLQAQQKQKQERQAALTAADTTPNELPPSDFNYSADRPAQQTESHAQTLNYNQKYTFDNFIVGASNKLAHAAALAVSKSPGVAYNPLFIYGPPGLGKTHLMYAIVNQMLLRDPNANAIYTTGEDFTNDLVAAIANKTTEAFRRKYRRADALLVDDIQFIATREGSKEEFFHTFNALFGSSRQIIMTSDRPPKELTGFEERIRTRFEQGLIADIGMPNYELRLAILKNKAKLMGMNISEDLLAYIAETLNSSNRQLEGVLNHIRANSLLVQKEVTLEIVQASLRNFQQAPVPTKNRAEKILDAVCTHYKISREDILGTSRAAPIKNPRNMAMYIIRTETDMSFPDIGKLFGRDHSTVMSNVDATSKKISSSLVLEKEVEEIKRLI